jgi:hypothetical protein
MAALAAVLALSACGRAPVSIAEACPAGAAYPKCGNAKLVEIAMAAARR